MENENNPNLMVIHKRKVKKTVKKAYNSVATSNNYDDYNVEIKIPTSPNVEVQSSA